MKEGEADCPDLYLDFENLELKDEADKDSESEVEEGPCDDDENGKHEEYENFGIGCVGGEEEEDIEEVEDNDSADESKDVVLGDAGENEEGCNDDDDYDCYGSDNNDEHCGYDDEDYGSDDF